jgi:erythromycin esterase
MRISQFRLKATTFLLFAYPISTLGQTVPIQAFRHWARSHAHPLASTGEHIHDDHETLVIRNRLIQYGVTHLGLRAVALETCLSSSKTLYDYILGRSDENESDLKRDFCYGFGDFPENLDLVHWLRTFNATQPREHKVHFYGIDLSGQYQPSAYRSLNDVLTYLDRADPALGQEVRARLATVIPIFPIRSVSKTGCS